MCYLEQLELNLAGESWKMVEQSRVVHPRLEGAGVFIYRLPSVISRELLPGALTPWPFPAWVEWVATARKSPQEDSHSAGTQKPGCVLGNGKC